MTALSPWVEALGPRFERLHPRLRAYFGTIPAGSIGYGRGTFARVGSPRRWLRPILVLLAAEGILYPVWAANVAFRIRNEPGPSRVEARRRFDFAAAPWTMRDVVSIERGMLVDRLGRHGILSVTLQAEAGPVDLDASAPGDVRDEFEKLVQAMERMTAEQIDEATDEVHENYRFALCAECRRDVHHRMKSRSNITGSY